MALAHPDVETGPARSALLGFLRSEPGATVADLARAAALAHSTTGYHLRRLEKTGAVVSVRRGAKLHYFVNGQSPGAERALAIVRRSGRSETVLARVPDDTALPLGDIADGLPMTKAGVHWHLERLVALGLITAEGVPRRYRRS